MKAAQISVTIGIRYLLSVPASLWRKFCEVTSRERGKARSGYMPWGKSDEAAAAASIILLTRQLDELADESPSALGSRFRRRRGMGPYLKEIRSLLKESEPRVEVEVVLWPSTYRLLEPNAAACGCTEEEFVLRCLLYHSKLEEIDAKRKTREARFKATLAAKKAAAVKAPPAFAAFERGLKLDALGFADSIDKAEAAPRKRKTSKLLHELI